MQSFVKRARNSRHFSKFHRQRRLIRGMLIAFTFSISAAYSNCFWLKAPCGDFKHFLIALFDFYIHEKSRFLCDVYTEKCFLSTLRRFGSEIVKRVLLNRSLKTIAKHKLLLRTRRWFFLINSINFLWLFTDISNFIFPRFLFYQNSGFLQWNCFLPREIFFFRTASFECSTKTSCDGIRFCFSACSTDSPPCINGEKHNAMTMQTGVSESFA